MFVSTICNRGQELAMSLYKQTKRVKIEYFNFYDSSTYKIIDSVEPPILIFTAHAVEQLPRSSVVFDNLEPYKHKIKTVLHFEPLYEIHDESLIGMMRRRYAEINDYNIDIVSKLKSRSHIRITHLEPNIIGLNPLNPTSIVQWVYCEV